MMQQFLSLLIFVLFLELAQGKTPKAHPESKDVVGASFRTQRTALRPVVVPETHRPPMLELMSLNLDTWGSKAVNSSDKPPELMMIDEEGHVVQPSGFFGHEQFNPLAQAPQMANIYDPRSLQTVSLDEALTLHLYSMKMFEPNGGHLLTTLVIGLVITLLMAYCVTTVCCDASDAEVEHLASPSKDKLSKSDMSQSSWARAYYEAEGDHKEAFELLFRCNIISTEEFACSEVSQAHIHECLWIAKHMLQNKPLEEWVALWQQAQQSFEDNVAECFESRGGPQVALTARSLAQRLKGSRGGAYGSPSSPSTGTSMPSSANLDYHPGAGSADQDLDLRPLHS